MPHGQRTIGTSSHWNWGCVCSTDTFSIIPWPSIMGNLDKKCMRPRPSRSTLEWFCPHSGGLRIEPQLPPSAAPGPVPSYKTDCWSAVVSVCKCSRPSEGHSPTWKLECKEARVWEWPHIWLQVWLAWLIRMEENAPGKWNFIWTYWHFFAKLVGRADPSWWARWAVIVYCHRLEVLHPFWTKGPNFYFALGYANYIAGFTWNI